MCRNAVIYESDCAIFTLPDNFEFYSDFLIRRGIKNNYGDKEIYPYLTEILVAVSVYFPLYFIIISIHVTS